MGTRTYSRRASDGSYRLTELGRARERARLTDLPSIFTGLSFVPIEGNSEDFDPTAGGVQRMKQVYRTIIDLIYDSTPESVDAYLNTIAGANASEKEGFVQRNALALTAIGMDGTPEQRERAIHLLRAYLSPHSLEMRTLQLGSMDYLYAASKSDEAFIKNFWTRWANYGVIATSRMGWAQLHSYMAEIGPNKGLPYPNDFYEDGRRPIQVNPKIVALLQREYERVQEKLKQQKYPENGYVLYRGTSQPPGLSMESFSKSKKIAKIFAERGGVSISSYDGGDVRVEKVPRRFIMGSYTTIPDWPESRVMGKQEYMVLGTAFYASKEEGNLRDIPAVSGQTYQTL